MKNAGVDGEVWIDVVVSMGVWWLGSRPNVPGMYSMICPKLELLEGPIAVDPETTVFWFLNLFLVGIIVVDVEERANCKMRCRKM